MIKATPDEINFFTQVYSYKRQYIINEYNRLNKEMVTIEDQIERLNEKQTNKEEEHEKRPLWEKPFVKLNLNGIKREINLLKKKKKNTIKKIKIIEQGMGVEKAIELYRELQNHPDVDATAIYNYNMTLIIQTKPIWNSRAFKIEMDLGGVFKGVKIYSIGYCFEEYPHPHVSSGGMVCFGNMKLKIEKAIKMGGFYSVALLCLELLKNPNYANAFRS